MHSPGSRRAQSVSSVSSETLSGLFTHFAGMSDSSKTLSGARYLDVLSQSEDRLKQCILSSIFGNQRGIKIGLSEYHIVVRFTDVFFSLDTFFQGSRSRDTPNLSKIKRFYPIMQEIQRDLKYRFTVGDTAETPLSMEHLTMKITFHVSDRYLSEVGLTREKMTTESLIKYILALWNEIKNRLYDRGYTS